MEPCSKPQHFNYESDISQITTADSSPMIGAGQNGLKNLRSSRTSKFARQMRESTISNFEFDQESDNKNALSNRFAYRSRHFATVEPTKSEFVSVNFLIPIELLAKDFTPILGQTIKSEFLIESLNIKLNVLKEQTICCLIKHSIETINNLLFKRKTEYCFSEDISKYSLRASKKSGLPDFDFPGKHNFFNNNSF